MKKNAFCFLACIIMFSFFMNYVYSDDYFDAEAVIDWTKSDGAINRGIFSTQGFMQVYIEKNPLVLQTFMLINPKDTHTRLETYIHQMEPANDDDDPNHFNWSKFYPQKMIRFIDDRTAFEKKLKELGMEPLSLLCYNVDWLKSDNPDYPIKSIPEWVEFAAAVVESYNGTKEKYSQNLKYVEVWNEPNMSDFYTGNMDSYFKLFNATAERIHRNYPGVMVGGPALTHAPHCKPEEWMVEFLKECAPNADYLSYHPYGESVEKIISDIQRWAKEFRKIPGKEQGKIMLTETDQWTNGWEKIQYVLERQFRFLDISDLIISIHHFCCLAYRESGNYTFGIVDHNGAVIEGTFYPYWLFRNLIGDKAYFKKGGKEEKSFDLCASHYSKDEKWIGTAVFHNKSNKEITINTTLSYPPSDNDRVLAINRVAENFKGVDKLITIPKNSKEYKLNLKLSSREGASLNLQDAGERIFNFSDINNQETPFINLTSSLQTINFLESCQLHVSIINTTFNNIDGVIKIKGLPENWKCELISGEDKISLTSLNDSKSCVFRLTASGMVNEKYIAPYAVLLPEGKNVSDFENYPHSIPVSLEFINPLKTQILPLPIYAVRGEENSVTLQIVNQIDKNIEGNFEFIPPEGCEVSTLPSGFTLSAKSRGRFNFKFKINEGSSLGMKTGKIKIKYLNSEIINPFDVEIVEREKSVKAKILDISKLANIDAVAYDSKRTDFDSGKIGMFVYPGDFTPSDMIQNIRGVPYQFLSSDDGKKNAILPEGQTITVEEGKYKGVSFIGYGHDGKHPGTWVFNYSDGTKEPVDSQIPEWCCPSPEGFEVAFNAPYRYIPGGPATPPCQLFAWALKTNPSKTLKSIEFPKMTHAYIFSITLIGE